MNTRTTSRRWRLAGTAAVLAATLGLVAACRSSSAATSDQTSAVASAQGQSGPGDQAGGQQQRSAANGTIAAVNGSTMQVQSSSSQTTVNFSDSTTITASQSADLTAVAAGLCITAAAMPTGQGPGEAASSAGPTSSADVSTGFTATTISLSDPESGECSVGFGADGGGGGGTPPSGMEMPTDGAMPSGMAMPNGGGAVPSGAPEGGGGGFGGFNRATGTVTSVSGDSIVISSTNPQTQAATETTVTVDGSTTYTKRTAATAAALVVGQCAVVQGSTDNKGAVTATSIAVSAPTSGSTCTTGFGGGAGGRGQGGAGQGGAATTTGS